MSNPFSGIITSEMKTLFKNGIDSLLESTACTVPCRLVFGDTKWTDCPNCEWDAINQRSSNVWTPGGPIEFHTGLDPYCNGIGRFKDETSNFVNVNFIVLWDYKDWVGWHGTTEDSRTAEGLVQTMSAISTITNIKRAKEIIINTDLEKYTEHKFTRWGEPNPAGLGEDAYIFTMWKRAG